MKIVQANGQTCNKFWTYANYLADSIETGEKIIILAPDISIKDYSNLMSSKIIKFPFYFESISKIIGYRSNIKLLNFILANKVSTKIFSIFFIFIPRVHFVDAHTGGYISGKRGKYKKVLDELFAPNQIIIDEVNSIFETYKEKKKIICGVHMRRGDYKEFEGGKYFYSNEQYHSLMLNIISVFPEKEVSFFVASNEHIDFSAFDNCDCFSIPNGSATKDLLGLSICDYIIGPSSTFSGWASYYSNIPIYFIENPNNKIDKSSFFQIMEIWN
ncbi:MAG: hypothetical protein ACI87N_000261 [Flavobacteriales bacterium]|jgi:hypothetical protein